MGGCATKPKVLKEETDAPLPAEDIVVGDGQGSTVEAVGEEKKTDVLKPEDDEAVEGRKSLANLLTVEVEDGATEAACDEKLNEENGGEAAAAGEAEPENQQIEEAVAAA